LLLQQFSHTDVLAEESISLSTTSSTCIPVVFDNLYTFMEEQILPKQFKDKGKEAQENWQVPLYTNR
jgi:hypothetical protein